MRRARLRAEANGEQPPSWALPVSRERPPVPVRAKVDAPKAAGPPPVKVLLPARMETAADAREAVRLIAVDPRSSAAQRRQASLDFERMCLAAEERERLSAAAPGPAPIVFPNRCPNCGERLLTVEPERKRKGPNPNGAPDAPMPISLAQATRPGEAP